MRYYSRHEDLSDPLQKAGCTRLGWDSGGRDPSVPGHYAVVPLIKIQRRVYIVPDCTASKQQPRFYVNIFKW